MMGPGRLLNSISPLDGPGEVEEGRTSEKGVGHLHIAVSQPHRRSTQIAGLLELTSI